MGFLECPHPIRINILTFLPRILMRAIELMWLARYDIAYACDEKWLTKNEVTYGKVFQALPEVNCHICETTLQDYICKTSFCETTLFIRWEYKIYNSIQYIARHRQRHRANKDLRRLTRQSYDRYNNYDDEDEEGHDGYDSYDDGDGDGDSYRSVGWNQVYSFQVKVKS